MPCSPTAAAAVPRQHRATDRSRRLSEPAPETRAKRQGRTSLTARIDAVAMAILRDMHHDPTGIRCAEREPLWVEHARLTNERDGIA